MKKITLFCAAAFSFSTMLTFAGNKAEVIIPGQDLSKKPFVMKKGLQDGEDYLSKTIIFKAKQNYRQNCKVNSIDNILRVQDLLNSIGAKNLAKIYPHHEPPAQERNMLGQKLVDLSLIYSFKYTADMKLEKVINQLLSLGYFEYVEPWYVPKTFGIQLTPNDPSWNSQQYHLKGDVAGSINTVNGWNTNTGSASVVIGIVDTGTQPTHPDLAANYLGGYDVAMNDADPTWEGSNHGVGVSGDACAVTNNGVGVASPGFNCKFKAAKIADAAGDLIAAYQGITWCADNGCKIINCSWGGEGGGTYGQDVVNYAAINKNCLVIAAAGNVTADVVNEDLIYPGCYTNAYRVSNTASNDGVASSSCYGLDTDWTAPGVNIYSTSSGTSYGASTGTSMSSPVSAGAAGLVQSQFNYTNAFQIGEKLKQTCDPLSSSLYTQGKLGKGRIDVGKALTVAAKSIVVNPITVTDNNDDAFMPGETLSISGIFTSYLDPTSSSASATLSVASVSGGPAPTITNANFNIGVLATLASKNNNTAPYTVIINAGAPVNQTINFLITLTDGTFSGKYYFSVIVNVDYINVVINDVHTSITSKGRIGFNLDGTQQGLGFEYQGTSPAKQMLYEMSLMIGASSTAVSDMFRESAGGNTDFVSTTRVYQVNPTITSDFDLDGKFTDASSPSPIPVQVHHRTYAWSTAPYRKFIIVKYVIKNTGGSTLNNLAVGIVADYDITDAAQNKGGYDATNKMGYVYDVSTPSGTYAGIKLLTNGGTPNNYVLDLIAGGNGGIDCGTDFLTDEKYLSMTTSRNADGYPATGGDVMDCMSTFGLTINAGDSITVAFALIGGDNLVDIQASACAAQAKYDNGCVVGVNDTEADNFWMYNYPNPATNSFNIDYNIIGYDNASIRIMNSLGEVVRIFDNLAQGKNTLTVDASKFSTGNYFYQLKSGEAVLTKKLTIVK